MPQDAIDISYSEQLLRYAAEGQLARLVHERPFLTRELIAQGAGFATSKRVAGQTLSRVMSGGLPLNARRLMGLDEIIAALGPDLDGTGGLASLALRLSVEQRDRVDVSNLTGRVPPSWTPKLLKDQPVDDVGVLMQASALLSAFRATKKMDTRGASLQHVQDRYSQALELLGRRLVAISVSPPTARNYDAQVLLGLLASYVPGALMDWLEAELMFSPLGYRTWRTVTKLVTLSGESGLETDTLQAFVRRLLLSSNDLRQRSVYPGRALDMELATVVPVSWSPPEEGPERDWAGLALRERAWNPDATIRERGSAAMGLWERAVRGGEAARSKAKDDLLELAKRFREPGTRPDAPAGMRWIAATIEHVIETGQAVCNDWPEVDEPWLRNVQEAAAELGRDRSLPASLVAGTKSLFCHMTLQNSAVYRSQAVETVVASGWSLPVARALSLLLQKEKEEAWLRIRAEAALGLLQLPRDNHTEDDLTAACVRAYQQLHAHEIPEDGRETKVDKPPKQRITELHATLFAIGDCFGVAGVEDRARAARERVRPVLEGLANARSPRARILRRPTRAAAYLLTVTAQPVSGGGKDLSRELLEKLSEHPDPVTKRFSDWALAFRFDDDGAVRPLLASAERPIDESPWPVEYPWPWPS
jgi:hypothetical protein